MSDIRRTSTHKCDWHHYNEPDGTCDCDWECTHCGQKWHGSGGHDSQKCADLLVQRLEQSLRDTIHADSKAKGEDRSVIDAQAVEIARLREQVAEEMDDYQGRLWCALGQPLNIEYIEAVKQMREQVRVLSEALTIAISRGCGCFNVKDENWHSDRCWIPIAHAALANKEPRP